MSDLTIYSDSGENVSISVSDESTTDGRTHENKEMLIEDSDISTMDLVNGESRRIFLNRAYPWSSCGQLWMGADPNAPEGVGSGVLVGPRHVLTCYHCVPLRPNGKITETFFVPSHYRNAPAGNKDAPYGVHRVKHAYWYGKRHPNDRSNEYNSVDYAVMILEKPTGLGWAGTTVFKKEWVNRTDLCHVGYPGVDKRNTLKNFLQGRPSFEGGFRIQKSEDYTYNSPDGKKLHGRKLFTDADVFGGQSGGPIMHATKDSATVMGVCSAEGPVDGTGWSPDNGFAAVTPSVVSLINWTRKNFQ